VSNHFIHVETIQQITRSIAHGYERLRLQHPKFQHSELLHALALERQEHVSRSEPAAAESLARCLAPVLSNKESTLGQLALGISFDAIKYDRESLDPADLSRLQDSVDSEVCRALGYVPDSSETSMKQSRRRDALLATEDGYRSYLSSTFGVKLPLGRPVAAWENSVLQRQSDWEKAQRQVFQLGLPAHFQASKNWDSLAAVDCVLRRTGIDAPVLDAGTELYSVFLPTLFLYGYRNLVGINLVFEAPFYLGSIRYQPGDIVNTGFSDATFVAAACLSVIEHGVDIERYFAEMSRILKPGGILVTSTDYYETEIDTKGAADFGVPVRIFHRQDISKALDIARQHGLRLTSPLNLECVEKAVRWDEFSLEYTYLIFTLRKEMFGRNAGSAKL